MSTPAWTSRPAHIIDVTRIVRLAEQSEHPDPSVVNAASEARLRNVSRELVAGNVNLSKAGSMAPLFLSHGALEHGKVFVAEDDEGIAGASVWFPADLQNPVGVIAEFTDLVNREVGPAEVQMPDLADGVQFANATVGLLTSLEESKAQWLLVAVITRPELIRDTELGHALVAPMFEMDVPLSALVLRQAVADLLAQVGFTQIATAIVSPNPPHELELSLLTRG